MTSLMLSLPDRSEGCWCSQHGRRCGETGVHMKINLPIFKDKDAKDAVTYQSLEVGFDGIPLCRM